MRSLSFVLFALVAILAMFAAQPAMAQGPTSGAVDCTIALFNITTADGSFIVWNGTIPDFTVPLYYTLDQDLPSTPVLIKLTMENLTIAHGFVETRFNGSSGALISNVSQDVVDSSPASASFSTACGAANIVIVHSYYRYQFPGINPLTGQPNYVTCDFNYALLIRNKACCTVCGDPQFSGLRGQSYQVHGIDGAVYSLISAPTYLVNSRFQFLNGPRACPVMPTTGRKSVACWSHPGSYLGSVAVRTVAGDVLLVESGSAATGFSSVIFNGKAMAVSDAASFASDMGAVSVNSTHEMIVTVGDFRVEIENIDGFVNLRSVRVSSDGFQQLRSQRVHGLLGQTWQSRRYGGLVKEIEGEVDDYVITDDTLTGSDFVFSRFAISA